MKINYLITGVSVGILLFSAPLLSARGGERSFQGGNEHFQGEHRNYNQGQFNENHAGNAYVHGFKQGFQYGQMEGGAYGGYYSQPQTFPQPSAPQQSIPDPANIPTTPYSEMTQVPFNPD